MDINSNSFTWFIDDSDGEAVARDELRFDPGEEILIALEAWLLVCRIIGLGNQLQVGSSLFGGKGSSACIIQWDTAVQFQTSGTRNFIHLPVRSCCLGLRPEGMSHPATAETNTPPSLHRGHRSEGTLSL